MFGLLARQALKRSTIAKVPRRNLKILIPVLSMIIELKRIVFSANRWGCFLTVFTIAELSLCISSERGLFKTIASYLLLPEAEPSVLSQYAL